MSRPYTKQQITVKCEERFLDWIVTAKVALMLAHGADPAFLQVAHIQGGLHMLDVLDKGGWLRIPEDA